MQEAFVMLHILEHTLSHTIEDSVKLLPFLFFTYLLMELLEHTTGGKVQKNFRRLVFRADGSISSRPGDLLYLQSRNKQNPVLVLYRTHRPDDGLFAVPFLREVRPPRKTSRRERKFCYLFASLAFKLLSLYARGLVLYCSDCGFVRVFGNFSADFSRFVSRSEGCEAE